MLNRRNKPAEWRVFPATRQIPHRRQETPMNTVRLRIPVALLLALLLAGCGGSAPTTSSTTAPAAEAPTATPASSAPPAAANDPSRKIIKDAALTLEVASIDLA